VSETAEQVYVVEGMSCGHCRTAVIEEVEQVAGVSGVTVDLETGRLAVRGEGVTDVAVERAVEGAGYEVRAA
jgi:copper chaperone CopZ